MNRISILSNICEFPLKGIYKFSIELLFAEFFKKLSLCVLIN